MICQLCESSFEGNMSRAILILSFAFFYCMSILYIEPEFSVVVAAFLTLIVCIMRELVSRWQPQRESDEEAPAENVITVIQIDDLAPLDFAALVVRTMDKRDESPLCEICLEEIKEGDLVANSPNKECIHSFHKECIRQALGRTPTCPCCRRDYLKVSEDGLNNQAIMEGNDDTI